MTRPVRRAVGCALVWLAAAAAGAATNETVITSDTLDYDYGRSIAVFKGNVRAVDGDVTITADRLNVLMGADDAITSLTAVGHVRIVQGTRNAVCRKAIYLAAVREVILTGDAEMRWDDDRVAGDIITIWLDENRMEVEPGTLVVHPREGQGVLPGGTRDGT